MTTTYTTNLELPQFGALGEEAGNWHNIWNTQNSRIENRLAATFAGDPNGNVAGEFVGQRCYDTTNDIEYVCTTIGTAINAVWERANIATTQITGTLADARVAESNVTQHEAALSISESQLTDRGTVRIEYTKPQHIKQETLTDATNISWDLDVALNATVTLGGNRTLDNPTNMDAGKVCYLLVVQDGSGSRTLSYGNAYLWSGGTAPTLSTGANAVDLLCFVCDGTNMYGSSIKDFQ